MSLSYMKEEITSPEGVACLVLDTSSVDFSGAVLGRKSAKTLVRRAKGGEQIETKNAQGQTESTYTARPGDAIFVNIHNPSDHYVPASDGTRWAFDELASRGYETIGQGSSPDEVIVKNTEAFKVLPEAVAQPTCIKDAWGPGEHQFLYPGATLKLNDNGSVTGIDQDDFKATWEIISTPLRAPGAKAKPPRLG